MQTILLVYVFCKKIVVFPATSKEAAVVAQNN